MCVVIFLLAFFFSVCLTLESCVYIEGKMGTKKAVQWSDFHQVRLEERHRDALLSPVQTLGDPELQQGVLNSYFVPKLVTLCVEVIAANFAALPDADGLREDYPKLYDKVIEKLSTDLPLTVSVPRVVSDAYWRRCCEARWSFGQLSERTCGKLRPLDCEGWKQFYFERVLSDLLTGFRSPEMVDEEVEELHRLCAVCRDHVYALDLGCQVSRFVLYDVLLSRMPHLETLRLTYGVSNVGMGFEWSMMGFSESDALNVRDALIRYPPLRCLRLPNNRLNSVLLKGVLSGLARNTSITVLDFSSNRIDDEGAEQLALLLCKRDLPLEELYLQDNVIRAGGAAAFGEALLMNTTLRVLDLRLNRIPDGAGCAGLIAALASHPALETLDLSHNRLGDEVARALAEVLPKQNSLLSLSVSGNKTFGQTSGELLLSALRENETLRFFDARGCGMEEKCLAAMEEKVQSVVQAIKRKDLDLKEEAQNARIRHEVEEKLLKTLST